MSKAECARAGCGRESRTRGLCHNHYQQWLYANRRTAQARTYQPRKAVAGRFRDRFSEGQPGECWPWRGAVDANGYGAFYVPGVGNRGAHRVALELRDGERRGMLACHHCDNPICVNPAHLYWGTHADNNRDAKVRRRTLSGEAQPNARLTESQVIEIRVKRRDHHTSVMQLAAEFGVSHTTILKIIRGKMWPYVGGPIEQKGSAHVER